MSDNNGDGGPGRRRGSMLQSLAAADTAPPPQALRSADGTVSDWFRMRVAAQQFMNEHGPLFAALARTSDAPEPLIERGSLVQAILASTDLATAVARRFVGRQDPTPNEIRPFRHAAAQVVAAAWQGPGLGTLATDAVADQHAAAFQIVDEDLDRSPFRDAGLSDEASLRMTSYSVTLALMAPVMTYDFRRDRSTLVSGMANAVMDMAAETLSQVVPEGARPDERRSMLQTAANRLAEIMVSVYDRKARQAVSHVAGLPEGEREAFARRYDPMPEVIRAFREWGLVFAATSLAFARNASAASSGSRADSSQPRAA